MGCSSRANSCSRQQYYPLTFFGIGCDALHVGTSQINGFGKHSDENIKRYALIHVLCGERKLKQYSQYYWERY
jgi:hypothetical protein